MLFESAPDQAVLITPAEARAIIVQGHYTHTFPAAWSRTYRVGAAVVSFGFSSNPFLERFLFTEKVGLLDLRRLWAPDNHESNLLTRAIALAVRQLRIDVPSCQAVVAFADPNVGHAGGVYQAASWLYTGQSAFVERGWLREDGTIAPRRSFHGAAGAYRPVGLPKAIGQGKHRYVRCLTRKGHKALRLSAQPYPKPGKL